MERLLSLRALERDSGISRRFWRKKVETGELPAYQPTGRTIRVYPSDAQACLRRERIRVTDHARARVDERMAHESRAGSG